MSQTRGLLSRRRVVGLLLGLPAVIAVPTGSVFAVGYTRARVDASGRTPLDTPLAFPPEDEGTVHESGRRVFDLTVASGETDLGFASPTPTWGVNGSFLGPTLRMRRGDQVALAVRNDLQERTTLHWHGVHLPAAMDGGPHQMVEPGGTWTPEWEVDQPAATLWYHPHLHDVTTQHVYRGVTGMIIVDDDESADLDLPNQYGVDDLPLIVQDKKFTADGRLDEGDGFMALTGLLGDTAMVNGTIGAFHDVTTERVRLRLLNASTARIYNIGFDDDRTFALIGTDGGLLAEPLGVTRVQLSPGERAEAVVAMRPSERTVLRSYAPELGAFAVQARFSGGHDTFDLLELRAAGRLVGSPELPGRLADDPFAEIAESAVVRTRYFQLQGDEINGVVMDMSRIDTVVEAGATEIWEVSNGQGYPHNFHVHDVAFRVLDVAGETPGPLESGRKDTVYVPPGQTVRLLIRFGDLTDPDSPYMYHCHLLRHEDGGMMGQFVVVEPGTAAGVVATEHHGALAP